MSKATPKTKSRTPSAADLVDLIRDQRSSGKSIAAFAREHGVQAHRLYQARNRLARQRREQATHEDLQRLHVVDLPEHGDPVELVLPAGLSIRVGRDFDEVALRRLLGVLVSC